MSQYKWRKDPTTIKEEHGKGGQKQEKENDNIDLWQKPRKPSSL
jgi:hypothetical protein